MSVKAFSVCEDIRDELAKRFGTVGSVAVDSDKLPYVLVGAGTAGSQSALVKVVDYTTLGTNAIGQSVVGYGNPVVIQVVLEASTISNVPLLTGANLLPLLGTLAKRGARIQLWLSANTNAVDVTDITGAPAATFDPDVKFKLSGQV